MVGIDPDRLTELGYETKVRGSIGELEVLILFQSYQTTTMT